MLGGKYFKYVKISDIKNNGDEFEYYSVHTNTKKNTRKIFFYRAIGKLPDILPREDQIYMKLNIETILTISDELVTTDKISDVTSKKLMAEYDSYQFFFNNEDNNEDNINSTKYKTSTSDSEDKSSVVSSTTSDMSERSIGNFEADNKEIMNTTFMENRNFTVLDLGIKISGCFTRKELLTMAKKCLIYVILDKDELSRWYGYYPTGVKRVVQNLDEWTYMLETKKIIRLGKFLHQNMIYGFAVKTMQDIPNLEKKLNIPLKSTDAEHSYTFLNEKEPFILRYDQQLPLTHMFAHYKFDYEGVKYLHCGSKLLEEYKDWRSHYRSRIDINRYEYLHNKLMNDNVTSSRSFTVTIDIGTDDDEKRLYRKEYGKGQWRIYRK